MKRTIEKIIDYARLVADPDKIFLFGSVANGKTTVYSDVDLLLIVDSLQGEANTREKITNFARENSLKIDVLIRTHVQIDEESLQSNSFVKSILQHGKKMYEKE